jgi:hypothetical protein
MLQKLYRPVGLIELGLIAETDFGKFPPRLDWQPIFYPVLNFGYAQEIAQKWNLNDKASGYSGFVTEFELPKTYLARFEVQIVGNSNHAEMWIPAEELDAFNSQIVGQIRVSAAFYGTKYEGKLAQTSLFKDKNTAEQAQILEKASLEDLEKLLISEKAAIVANFGYWKQHFPEAAFLENVRKSYEKTLNF